MKFYCRIDHFKQRQGFTVKNEQFHNVYKVKGSFVYGLKRLTIKDWNDEVMFHVRKAFNLRTQRYDVKDAQGTPVATLSYVKKEWVCDFPSGEHYTVHREEDRLVFHLNDQPIVTFAREDHPHPDPLYAIDIAPQRQPLLNLTCMLAMKQIMLGHRERRA